MHAAIQVWIHIITRRRCMQHVCNRTILSMEVDSKSLKAIFSVIEMSPFLWLVFNIPRHTVSTDSAKDCSNQAFSNIFRSENRMEKNKLAFWTSFSIANVGWHRPRYVLIFHYIFHTPHARQEQSASLLFLFLRTWGMLAEGFYLCFCFPRNEWRHAQGLLSAMTQDPYPTLHQYPRGRKLRTLLAFRHAWHLLKDLWSS